MFSFNSTLKKILVVFLIITLTYANLILIGTNITKSFSAYAVEETGKTEAETETEKKTEGEETSDPLTEEEKELLTIDNKDIHKTKISEDGKTEFSENLEINLKNVNSNSNIIIEDVSNEFYDDKDALNEAISFKYNKTVMNKLELLSLLGEEGKLVIKDAATEKTLAEITSKAINEQTVDEKTEQKFSIEETQEVRTYITVKEEIVEIEYSIEIENIKFELNNITVKKCEVETGTETEAEPETEKEENTKFIITNTINISNINNVETLSYLKENKKVTLNETENIESIIKFKDTITRASLAVDNTKWIAGKANTVKYTITLDTKTEKSEMFINPMFLLELPASVENVNTKNSVFTVNNDNGAFTGKNVFVTTILGRKFVVINLEGEQTAETIKNGETTINVTLELNVEESVEGEQITKLYYKNDTVTAYESEKSFDTANVTVELVIESEPKDNIEEDITSDEVVLNSKSFALEVKSNKTEETGLKKDDDIKYTTVIENNVGIKINNLKLTATIPENLEIEKVTSNGIRYDDDDDEIKELKYKFDKETRKITIDLDSIEAVKWVYIDLHVKDEPKLTSYEKISFSTALMQNDKTIVESNEVINYIGKTEAKMTITGMPEAVNELEKFTFSVIIENKEKIKDEVRALKVEVPAEITLTHYSMTVSNEDDEEYEPYKVEANLKGQIFDMDYINLLAGEKYLIEITAKANNVTEDTKATVSCKFGNNEQKIDIILKNVIEEPTEPTEPTEPEKPSNPNNPETPTEPSDSEIPNNPGDTDNPTEPTNPDQPNESDKTEEFDLSLKQYVNKITVENSKGTTTYNYENTDFAKVEIHSKQMAGSKITIEYKMIVKNEGTIAGYARKIVNYKPEGLEFNKELNSNWYVGDDGNIYSTAFIDKLLEPGETEELTIVFTKEMTRDNTGIIKNTMEIYEASNEKNIEDINSIPGDKLEEQNDMSTVKVLVVTSTGTVVLYMTLALTVLTIIGFGFYKVRRVTMNKGGC